MPSTCTPLLNYFFCELPVLYFARFCTHCFEASPDLCPVLFRGQSDGVIENADNSKERSLQLKDEAVQLEERVELGESPGAPPTSGQGLSDVSHLQR